MTLTTAAPPLLSPVVQQHALSIIAEVAADKLAELRSLLQEIGNDIRGNGHIRFAALSTTHFCRFVILPASADLGITASLAFESNFDGDLDVHVEELIAAGSGVTQIFGYCVGFPSSAAPAEVKAFLLGKQIPVAAFYMGHRGLSLRWIRNDIEVRNEVERYLDSLPSNSGQSSDATTVRVGAQQHLANRPQLSTERFDRGLRSAWSALPFVAIGIILAIGLLPLTILILASFAIALRWREKRDPSDGLQTTFSISNLVDLEDRVIQNQLTHLVPLKPGLFRLWTLRIVLWAIDRLAEYKFNKGDLGGIPSIHFARWSIIDGGRRLLFFSNYDGSWENYLGDFIDKANRGLTAVWSNTAGFPPTRWLVGQGAIHEEQFKQWTRMHQLPTQVWYSAYPDQTVQNILDNCQVRQGVGAPLSRREVAAWLDKL